MARILYGVQADGSGHINRARILAEEMPHHDFLFIGGERIRGLEKTGHSVEIVPFMTTVYRDNRVDFCKTAAQGLRTLLDRKSTIERICGIIRGFDPDLIMSDYEYFTPLAARKLGRFSVSLDNQHILTLCKYHRPRGQIISRIAGNSVIRLFFSNADHFLVTSFFPLKPANSGTTEIFPPLIKKSVLEALPSVGEHVLVYQTSETCKRLLPALEFIDKRFFIYGLGKLPERKNLTFKERSQESFVADLASCDYVLANGGHNVISEALYLGKPVLSFPLFNHYEQFTNAYFLNKMGYGASAIDRIPSPSFFRAFHGRLEQYKINIRSQTFYGNKLLVQHIEALREGRTENREKKVF